MTTPPTFGLTTSEDLLKELRGTVSDLDKDPVNPRLARYAAIVAWSMCDWVQIELRQPVRRSQIKKRCPALGYLQELANVFKHRELRPSTPVILAAAVETGTFSRQFSREFDILRLELVLEDGSRLWFEDVIQEALDFWDHFFDENGLTHAEGQGS